MIHNPDPAAWISPVIHYIRTSLPVLFHSGLEWDHRFVSAYQFGCDALVAFGQAEETTRGARPLLYPRPPETLPRWDDICVTVLSLADQKGHLSYRQLDGREAPNEARWCARREGEITPQPNIMASHGLGPAWASKESLPVLRALGLVKSGRWTAAAEPVLWREEPQGWNLDITADLRFQHAMHLAITEMPADIRHEFERLVTITEVDVTEGLIRREIHQRGLRSEHGANRVICLPLTRHSVMKGLVFVRIRELDGLFFTNWRLPGGWLRQSERERALEIFHDKLAIRMRRAIVSKLYPSKLEFLQCFLQIAGHQTEGSTTRSGPNPSPHPGQDPGRLRECSLDTHSSGHRRAFGSWNPRHDAALSLLVQGGPNARMVCDGRYLRRRRSPRSIRYGGF